VLLGCLLFLMFVVNIAVRTNIRMHRISNFEIGQAMLAFLLAAAGVLYFVPQAGQIWLGATCRGMSVVFYILAFAGVTNTSEGRNGPVFSTRACGLLLSGCLLSLNPTGQTISLGLAALITCVTALGLANGGSLCARSNSLELPAGRTRLWRRSCCLWIFGMDTGVYCRINLPVCGDADWSAADFEDGPKERDDSGNSNRGLMHFL